ncbi:prolipoprotein diacylglyceryl transferase [Alloprevotella sp. OH1205_COT-284]|uniref:prolipoprotein diacylglyceryl transferase n=1 Tax=Alloprevotella sp. OH1205_COT-284 TaxID=2491043 RepID=UPI000F5FC9BA|nr:prolipoprotein diacylglyceryl transferase [Alloprevotella sp. OH1205_COT-284]RRD79754.1 prolipoprotein diacylglyceryl transferase [Alloprevotella sp. OH1205_COT-284]
MVIWNPDEVALHFGPLAIRWYSLFWTIGLGAAYVIVYRLYKQQRIPQEKFDPLFFYCFLGILIGARLGHCLLYDPGYFLAHPIEMLLPIRQDGGGNWHFSGYSGLASHGGTLGLMIALWIYMRKTHISLMRVLDNIAIATPITACCIRLGNLMNSEIVGKYTGNEYGMVFAKLGETLPRHPGQLYEAVAYFVFFVVGMVFYKIWPRKVGTGFYFGFCLTSIFTFRFFVEFFKEVQEAWEIGMQSAIGLNQGQLLSIPFILIGLYFLLGGKLGKKWGDNGYTA